MNGVTEIIIYIAAVVGAVGSIVAAVQKTFKKIMQPFYEKLDKMDKRQCRAFLINFLSDIENGVEKDEVQIKFAYEIYDHYTNDLHCNSYVHDKWERVMNP